MKKIITSDDILGKEAVDPEGKTVGMVIKLHIDNSNQQIVGITIDQGFMKPDLFVGITHIKRFGVDAILLAKIPPDSFKGLKIVDADGKSVGVVKDVILKKTKIKEFIISPDGLLKKNMKIAFSDIKEIGVSVVLKAGHKLKAIKKEEIL